MSTPGTPLAKVNTADPGDDTQRRFRYQSAWGVVLLLDVRRRKLSYASIYCEHLDDFLCERGDGRFDAYQVKTRQADSGPFKIADEPLVHSIKRFVHLLRDFPNQFAQFYFVSNVRCFASTNETQRWHSPEFLKGAMDDAQHAPHFATDQVGHKCFERLAESCEATVEEIKKVLRLTTFVNGPELDSFETKLAHIDLPKQPECANLRPAELDGVRDELIQLVAVASSIPNDADGYQWGNVEAPNGSVPRIRAKCLRPEAADEILARLQPQPFRFAPIESKLFQASSEQESILEKKLAAGGLSTAATSMKRRRLSAERHLLEVVAREQADVDLVLNQLECAVQAICDDSRTVAESDNNADFGQAMYSMVKSAVEARLANASADLCGQSFDCIMGVVSQLTSDCKVWWSPPFDPGASK